MKDMIYLRLIYGIQPKQINSQSKIRPQFEKKAKIPVSAILFTLI